MNNGTFTPVEPMDSKMEDSIRTLIERLDILAEEMDGKVATMVGFLGNLSMEKCNMPERPQVDNVFTHLQAIEYTMRNALRNCDVVLKTLGI